MSISSPAAATAAAAPATPTTEEVTPENVASLIEARRLAFITSTDTVVRSNMEQAATAFTVLGEVLYTEIERGSREIAVLRELHFLIGKGALTQERWSSINQRLIAIEEERRAAATNTTTATSEAT